jgi:putative membrane protein
MTGVAQRTCAMVRGRTEQGMYFLDVRTRKLYTVIGQTHWEDPRQGFLDALGDTFAIRAKVWRYGSDAALAVTDVWPWRSQPEPVYRWWPWHWEWSVLLGCSLWAAGWMFVMTRVRRRLGRPWRRGDAWRGVVFGLGLAIVVLSLNGPIHDLSDRYLFSAHMVQHLLLAEAFPLLVILGVPGWAWRWVLGAPAVRTVWNALSRVPVGFCLYTIVFSIWHVPILYDLMMRQHSFHIVMHLMVMGTALLMWWPVAGGEAVERPLAPPATMLYLFLLGIPMMAVAAMITFAGQPLYTWYALAPRFWGFSPVEDQRLGGLIMWVPGGLFNWVIMSIVFFQWSARESRPMPSTLVLPTPTAGVWRSTPLPEPKE